jgi:hypothetical protein
MMLCLYLMYLMTVSLEIEETLIEHFVHRRGYSTLHRPKYWKQ